MEDFKKLKTKPVTVNLDKLKLDLTNVRYQHKEELIDEEKMGDFIWNESGTKQLYEQIKAARGLYEKPFIDANYVVLEGNRRLVCLKPG